MHPIEKKKRKLYALIVIIAICITIISIVYNYAYSLIIIAYVFFMIEKRGEIKNLLPLTATYLIVSNVFVFILDNFLFSILFNEAHQAPIRFFLSLSSFFMVFSFHFFKTKNSDFLKIIENELENFELINKHPHLLCRRHYTRTVQTKVFGFRNIRCRSKWLCFRRKWIREVEQLIGLIGKYDEQLTLKNKYYLTLWNPKSGNFRNADYDEIEIHNNDKIKDYDSIINKMISFFYNELKRFKPINEVTVRIIGNPEISESTKRLLEEKFLKVEYLRE